jgi:hypothetical protein
MARIRSIKPEFWTSENVMECSLQTRLFFIGLWNFCDDYGRHPTSAKQLKALIFPGDDIAPDAIRGMIDELSTNGLIELYTVEGKEYLLVTGWAHQKIDKRQDAKFPAPSSNCRVPFAERSPNGIDGEDRKGEDRDRNQKSESSSSVAARAEDDDDDLFRKLKGAAKGNIAPSCRNVGPVRKLLAEGVPIEAVLACFSANVAHLRQPLQTFGASFIPIEARAHAEALAQAAARGEDAAKAIELVFVAFDDPRWPLVEARYVRERGRKPPRDSRSLDGAKGLGWRFLASWPECHPAPSREAAE